MTKMKAVVEIELDWGADCTLSSDQLSEATILLDSIIEHGMDGLYTEIDLSWDRNNIPEPKEDMCYKVKSCDFS